MIRCALDLPWRGSTRSVVAERLAAPTEVRYQQIWPWTASLRLEANGSAESRLQY